MCVWKKGCHKAQQPARSKTLSAHVTVVLVSTFLRVVRSLEVLETDWVAFLKRKSKPCERGMDCSNGLFHLAFAAMFTIS